MSMPRRIPKQPMKSLATRSHRFRCWSRSRFRETPQNGTVSRSLDRLSVSKGRETWMVSTDKLCITLSSKSLDSQKLDRLFKV